MTKLEFYGMEISENHVYSYQHNINDTVDLSKYKLLDANLEIDFQSGITSLNFDRWPDGDEIVKYKFENGGWNRLGEIDTYDNPTGVDDVQTIGVDVAYLLDGILDVNL
jgi:hypothetical protein